LPHLLLIANDYDGFLVACYSKHPLVQLLQDALDARWLHRPGQRSKQARQFVTGILEASTAAAMTIASAKTGGAWGVVSTEHCWRDWINDTVSEFVGSTSAPQSYYAGCVTVGVQAEQLETTRHDILLPRMKDALNDLVGDSSPIPPQCLVIVLGCAGLGSLRGLIRQTCANIFGEQLGHAVAIISGVEIGIGTLLTLVSSHI